MTATERYIIETYSRLFENLNSITKLELLEILAKSIRKDSKLREKEFFKSFGAFASENSAEEIAKEIKETKKQQNQFKFGIGNKL